MYTIEEIEKFFSDNGWQIISILSKPRKNKYNRDVKIVAKCCRAEMQGAKYTVKALKSKK